MNNFLYGMWFMWFILCIYADERLTLLEFILIAVIAPGALVMISKGIWFLVRLVKFKWERRA